MKTTREFDERTDGKPWVVSRVSRSERSGIYVEGINRYKDEPFFWHLSTPVVQFDRYEFSGATYDGVDPAILKPSS